jgi:hypothetical protein
VTREIKELQNTAQAVEPPCAWQVVPVDLVVPHLGSNQWRRELRRVRQKDMSSVVVCVMIHAVRIPIRNHKPHLVFESIEKGHAYQKPTR